MWANNVINKILLTGTGVDSTDAASGPPKFVTQFSASYEVQEGQGCHLEARLTPAEDPHMNVSCILLNNLHSY